MFKKYFDAQDLITDGENGAYVRLPTNIPALPSNLHGKVMRADKLARLSTRIIPLLDLADEYHADASNESTMARNKQLPMAVRTGKLTLRNWLENKATHLERMAHAYFLAVINARYI